MDEDDLSHHFPVYPDGSFELVISEVRAISTQLHDLWRQYMSWYTFAFTANLLALSWIMPESFEFVASFLVRFLIGFLFALKLSLALRRKRQVPRQFHCDLGRRSEAFHQDIDDFAQLVQGHMHGWIGDLADPLFKRIVRPALRRNREVHRKPLHRNRGPNGSDIRPALPIGHR